MTNVTSKPPSYCSYILRCWGESRAPEGGTPAKTIRFSLEDPHTGERFGFSGPEALIQFLQAKIGGPEGSVYERAGITD